MVRRKFGVVHDDATQPSSSAKNIPPARRAWRTPNMNRILHRECDSNRGRAPGRIPHAIAQHSYWETRVLSIQRNNWAECLQLHSHRKLAVAKGDVSEGIFTFEDSRIQPAETRGIARPEAGRTFIGRGEAGFEHTSDWPCIFEARPDGSERILWRGASVRPIEDLPVAQLAPATQAYTSGGHATQRKSDLRQLPSREDARVMDRSPACTESEELAARGWAHRLTIVGRYPSVRARDLARRRARLRFHE